MIPIVGIWLFALSFFILVLVVGSTGEAELHASSSNSTVPETRGHHHKPVVVRSVGIYDEHGILVSDLAAKLLTPTRTVLILIHIAKKHYHTRLLTLRETWLQDHSIPEWATVMFYTTKEDGPAPGISPTIIVDTNEKPHDGNEQILSAFRISYEQFFAHTNSNLKWLIKIDDDSYLSWNALEKALQTKDANKPHYVGDCDCVSPGWQDAGRGCGIDFDCKPLEDVPIFKYVCGGSGVLLSKPALKLIVREEVNRRCIRTLEDITVAHCLLASNVQCTEMSFTAFLSLKTFGQKFMHTSSDVDFAKVCIWEVTNIHEFHLLHDRYMKILGTQSPSGNSTQTS